MPETAQNLDPGELEKFERLAREWWDEDGPYRTLHQINPLRLHYIESAVNLSGLRVLDVGCGGGLLAEALADRGAAVSAIDAGAEAIAAARRHAAARELPIHYECITVEQLAARREPPFGALTCMELLEHVPEPAAILRAAAALLRPGGDLFLSTINRTLPAWLGAIVVAEHLLGLLPRGTHSYARFIRPAELCAWLRAEGFDVIDVCGMHYLPWAGRAVLTRGSAINYLLHARRRS